VLSISAGHLNSYLTHLLAIKNHSRGKKKKKNPRIYTQTSAVAYIDTHHISITLEIIYKFLFGFLAGKRDGHL
jgi:hypothetical protein